MIIPLTNVADLQLSSEVTQAVREGKFHIYAVNHVSQGIEILTGKSYAEIVSLASARLDQLRPSLANRASRRQPRRGRRR